MARFTGRQFAFGQFTLPFGKVSETMGSLAATIGTSPPSLPEMKVQRIFQLIGPYDLLIELEPKSFRKLPEATRVLVTESTGCQWTLGKEIYADEAVYKKISAEKPLGTDPLSFVFFLRIHRETYRQGGATADHEIIRQIEDALLDSACGAKICASLGWADFIVTGRALKGRSGVFEILQRLLRLEVSNQAALQRSITLVGYEWTREGPPKCAEIDGFGLKLRLRPPAVGKVYKQLEKFLKSLIIEGEEKGKKGKEGKSYLLSYTGGKRDIVFLPRRRLRMKNMLLDKRTRNRWLKLAAKLHIEHSETNYLLGYWERDKTWPSAAGPSNTQPSASEVLADLIDLSAYHDLVPEGLRQSLYATYALFDAVLRDTYKNLDLETAIGACNGVLKETLEELKRLSDPDQSLRLTPADRYRWARRYHEDLKVWCSRAEKVVGERSAGSFENKMVPSPSLSPYRGHVNKILVTADLLVREMIRQVSKVFQPEGEGAKTFSPPAFHLGAAPVIESDLKAGVVTLPNKYMFSLILAVPQLWSESGVRIFHQIYQVPFRGVLAEWVEAYGRAAEDSAPGKEKDSRRPAKDGARRTESRRREDLLAELADHFADLIVRFFGLQTNKVFAQYLIAITTADLKSRKAPADMDDGHRRQQACELLQRLLMVFEVDLILQTCPDKRLAPVQDLGLEKHGVPWTASAGATPKTPQELYWSNPAPGGSQPRLLRPEPSQRQELLTVFLGKIVGQTANEMRREAQSSGSPQAEWPWPRFDGDIASAALEWALHPSFYACHWRMIEDFVERVYKKGGIPDAMQLSPNIYNNTKALKSGQVLPLQDELFINGYFARAYTVESNIRLRNEKKLPEGMAALGRSALLAFLRQSSMDLPA